MVHCVVVTVLWLLYCGSLCRGYCVVVTVLWFTVLWLLCCGQPVVVHRVVVTVLWLACGGLLCCGYSVVGKRPKPSSVRPFSTIPSPLLPTAIPHVGVSI